MKYYDISSVEVPSWFGFTDYVKPKVIEANTIKELRQKTKEKGLLLLKHPNEQVFRHSIDKSMIDAVLPNRSSGHDYLHHRRTILNNVTAKIMKKNNISLVFTIKELRETSSVKRGLVWGRMLQDMFICQKKSIPIIIASGAEKEQDLVSVNSLLALGELLGLKPIDAKKSLSYVHEQVLNR